MNREDMVEAIGDRSVVWDVIIIGGGATGLGAAVEAASRGHRTVLVEAGDFASGTSSRSTKLIHGGVRYLQMGQISLVRHSLQERSRLLRNAPHLVHLLEFVLPTYHRSSCLLYYTGLRLYDLLAGQLISGRAKCLSPEETCRRLPTLSDRGLRGGVLYTDGQFDDARLAVTLARTAVDHGGVVVNYLPVQRLLRTGDHVSGVVVLDVESGAEISLRGRSILNATGVFAEDILRLDSASEQFCPDENSPTVIPSQGSHLVFDASFLPGTNAVLIPKTDDGRVLFAIPWHGKVLFGTTDVAVGEVTRKPRPQEAEIDYLLSWAARYFRRAPARADIRAVFAGLRPLAATGRSAKSTAKLSREHVIHRSGSGLITVIGGKWTTYRQMGADLIDRAEREGGLTQRQSRTMDLRLHGCSAAGTPLRTANDALACYGTDSASIDELLQQHPELSRRLHSQLAYREVDVIWAIRHEMARTVEDILARRTRALFLDCQAAVESAPRVSELMQKELGRDDTWRLRQLENFTRIAADYAVSVEV